MTATTTLRVLTTLAFLAVAAVALRQARRQREQPSWWVFASFAVIAAVTVTLGLLPDDSTSVTVARIRRLTLATLPLFTYCLFRFTAALTPASRALHLAAAVLTALTSVSALVGVGGLRAGASSAYQVLLLVQWTFLSGVVARRLWRAGRGEPTVVRRRMRTMSAGAVGITIPLLLFGAAPEGAAISLVIRGTALASAVLFLLALAPPQALRVRWRRSEEARLRVAVSELMAATTPDQVTTTLLPQVAGVLGARGAALVDDDGEVVASYPPGLVDAQVPSQRGLEPRIDVFRLAAGRLTVYASPYTPLFGRDELELLATLGGLADLALQRCKDLGVAEMLQRSLLPETLPSLAGLDLQGRYLPSESGAVGGDWYDVIALPGGKVGLVIGDVMGHGLGAASLMGHLRSALRAYALDGTPPVTGLTRLQGYVDNLGVADLATALYAVIDPAAGTLDLASAGHPAPLLRTPDNEVRELAGGLGPPIGLFTSAPPEPARVHVPPGSALVLFTDGLIERRGESIDQGAGRLRDAVASAPGEGAALADHVLQQLVVAGTPDDVALLVAHLVPAVHAPTSRSATRSASGVGTPPG